MAYFKFKLSSGQQAPPGSTGHSLDGEWIIFEADEWPPSHNNITHESMTNQEITDYIARIYTQQADADIQAIASETQQRQMLVRAIELLEAKVDGTITPAQEAELTALKATRQQIADIRQDYESQAASAIAAATN